MADGIERCRKTYTEINESNNRYIARLTEENLALYKEKYAGNAAGIADGSVTIPQGDMRGIYKALRDGLAHGATNKYLELCLKVVAFHLLHHVPPSEIELYGLQRLLEDDETDFDVK
ncbi:hypothetical protein WJX72_011348 [[Myrmecia] bisecta]|uniref:Uncharacterized protein n=1 Tax=[Myrmecia] bisecta TaxID=41462 RepID=A0AAW1QA01_9CHLO